MRAAMLAASQCPVASCYALRCLTELLQKPVGMKVEQKSLFGCFFFFNSLNVKMLSAIAASMLISVAAAIVYNT